MDGNGIGTVCGNTDHVNMAHGNVDQEKVVLRDGRESVVLHKIRQVRT